MRGAAPPPPDIYYVVFPWRSGGGGYFFTGDLKMTSELIHQPQEYPVSLNTFSSINIRKHSIP